MYANTLEKRDAPVAARVEEFESLILPHEASLYPAAMSLTRSASDAEDLVQDTLLRAYARFDSFRSDGSPKAWLHTIMRNLFFNAYRKQTREPKQVSFTTLEENGGAENVIAAEESVSRPSVSSPERVVLSQMEGDALRRAVAALPSEYKQVVALADMAGLPYQEIADRLHIPVGTVRSRLNRGRKRVRRALWSWRPSDVGPASGAVPLPA